MLRVEPRRRAVLFLALALFVSLPAAVSAQQGQPFSIDDFFRYASQNVAALSPDGGRALVVETEGEGRFGIDNHRFGDPTYVAPTRSRISLVDTRTLEVTSFFDDERDLRRAAWSPLGDRLALMLRSGDPELARAGAPFTLFLWDEAEGLSEVPLPAGWFVSEDSSLEWVAGGDTLIFAMRSETWAAEAGERFRQEVHGPIVVRSSENDFLSWEGLRRMSLRKALAAYHPAEGRVEEVMTESEIGSWAVTADGARLRVHLDITEETDYTRIFGRDDRIVLRELHGEEEREIFETDRGVNVRWAGDGRSWVWTKDGELRFGAIGLDEPRVLWTRDEDSEDDERLSPSRLSHDGALLIATSDTGYWLVDTATGERERFIELDPDAEDPPNWSVAEWDRRGDRIYLTYSSRTEWDWAVHRYDRRTGEMTELLRDGRRYTGLQLSDDGSTALLNVAAPGQPARLHVADPDLNELRPFPDPNPWLSDRALGRSELIRYLDVDGERLFGIVHYPADYQAGQPYPVVFILYETFFEPGFNTTAALLNAEGYVVVQPSVRLEQGYPGEAWLKGVTSAANYLIERGVADPKRLGIQGGSYGGYAVSLLITQTPRFAAAINISGKTNMVSFYTDSPRLATRNIHAPERSQDRLGATLWEQPQKYIAHSAVMAADRVTTPLLLISGQQDHNVTERTTSEMYYALRRLDRDVEWVSYIDGGHGMPRSTRAEAVDYLERIMEWYERHMGLDTLANEDTDR